MDSICNHNLCTGCSICNYVCPKDAITMRIDTYGFLRPFIDNSKCVNCNLCKKKCHINNNINSINDISKQICYAGYTKTEQSKSYSGGISNAISSYVLYNNGIVYGCVMSIDKGPYHKRICDIDDLKAMQGSKYVQSDISGILKKLKEDVESGILVLFTGTPCQCAAVHSYINKKYDNLLLVDFVCHGVPSWNLLNENLHYLSKTKYNNISDIQFKKDCKYGMYIDYKKGISIHKSTNSDPYTWAFHSGVTYRSSCYECRYASIHRVSDITLGDFWGYGKLAPTLLKTNRKKSLILINTNKGEFIFEEIKNTIEYEERLKEEAIQGQGQLQGPFIKGKYANYFEKLYPIFKYNGLKFIWYRWRIIQFIKRLIRK